MFKNDLIKDIVDKLAIPLKREEYNNAPLMNMIGNSRFVLLGEATHGTLEFYETRAQITEHLIKHHNFNAVFIEWDWSDTYPAHCYVQGGGINPSISKALDGFQRFPDWMWRNSTMKSFLQWLRIFNENFNEPKYKVGLYGLDLYNLYRSIEMVINYLDNIDPEAASRAQNRYSCLNSDTNKNPQKYGFHVTSGVKKPCTDEVIAQLKELHEKQYNSTIGVSSKDDYFNICQNAEVIKSAEEYYRSMFQSHSISWNIRDYHMFQTVKNVEKYLGQKLGFPPKIIIWAHNSHVGNANATDRSASKEINIGQLLDEQYRGEVFKFGFTTYAGTVIAADNWNKPWKKKRIIPALPNSYEALFHEAKLNDFILDLKLCRSYENFMTPRLHRAIGVIYRPQTERASHYYFTSMPQQFDAIAHYDLTTHLIPLDAAKKFKKEDIAETWPLNE